MTLIEHRIARSVRAGFTLIELMIGLVIVGLLAGGIGYFGFTMMERAKRDNTKTTLQTIKLALTTYEQEKGEYPKSLQELVANNLLKKAPEDGWGQKFVYRVTPDGSHPYELYSYGPKGKAGGKASRIDAWAK